MAYLVLLFALLLPSAGNAQGATDGVCGRTQQVLDELVRLAGAGDCASVTAENLAEITDLDLDNKAIASLQAGDFAGLTSLVYLRLRNNQLSLDSFPGGLFSSLPLSIRYIEVSGNPGCPSYGNLCFPPAPTIDATVGTDTSGRTFARTDETVKLSSSQGDYRDPLGRSLLAAWSQNSGTVVNLATADNGWSAAFTVPHVTADEDAEFVLTVTTTGGLWARTILNNFWEEAKTQADLTFSPPLPSSDTSLSELEIYGVTPRYNSSTRIYELTVPNSVATVSVRANPRERNAVVVISPPDSQPATGHQVDLEPGANSISITVTATDEVTTQTYTVTVTRDESAGVCGRTQQVRDELVRLAGAGDCASVTADNLAAITNLDLENKAIASLQASDFAGLTSLVYLRLRNNQLSLDSFPGGLFSSLPLSIRYIEVSGNPGCPSYGNLCFPPTPTVDVLVGTDEREIAIVRTAETVRLRSGPGDYRDPLGRSLRTAWSQNTGTVVNLAAADNGWSAAFTVPHVTADEDAEFVLTVTTTGGLWARTILNNFWEEAKTQADLTFSPPDTAAPQVASIARQSPTSSPTRADSLTWRVTFSETVANVDEADFEVGVTAATLTVAAVPGSSVAHDVTVEGGNLAGLTGTVTLAFASDHDIADTAGNALTNTVPMDANDNTFELDNTAPTVTIGGVPETSTMPFTATITFTEPVTGFVLADIALANATAAAFTGADGDRAFTALITPTADGAVTVDVAADVARDAAGNGNAAAAQASSTYTAPSCAAPDLAGRERVWQGTLTVGRSAGGLLRELVGYGWTSRTGALSGRTAPIVLDANRYRIGDFVLLYAHTTNLDVVLGLPAAGTLVFHLVGATDRDAELTAAEKADLALHVCDARFDFSAATRRGEGGAAPPPGPGQDRHYLWENAGLTWSAGLVRTLTLSQPAVSGARAAAAVEGLPELTGPGEDGVYAAHDRIEVRVRFDAPVTVDASGGAPTLGLALGGIRREAAYVPGQDGDAATELVFALAVSGEDAGAGAAKAIANGIRLNGATIRDEGGADAVLDYGAAPGVVAVEVGAEPSGDGAWTAGEAVEVTLAFAEPVEVGTEGGTPSVGLTLPGAGARRAVYASGSGTDRLSFAYTLTGADGPVSAALVDPDGLAPGGGTIVSTGGLDAVLTHGGAGRPAGPRAPGPVLSVADAEGAEGGTLAFRVTLAPAASGPVTVAYATADGPSANGAAAGEDYTAASGTLAFKPGETEKTVAVAVAGDVLGEGAETLTLALSDATGASIGDGEATGTIGASAGPAALTASFLGVPPEHDGQDPFTVELRFSEEPQRLSYRTVRDSLFAVSGGTLAKARRFEPPANLRYELTLAPSGDGAVTLARAALPACGVPGAVCTGDGRSLSGALALSVPGPAALSVADAQVKEGPDATLAFAVTLDRVRHAAVTVDYATRDGTAVAGADYTNTSGTLTFVAGETRKTVDVQVLADSHDEGSETMTLALSNATGARIADGEATGTIDNSGSIPQAWIARFGRTVVEQVLEAVEGRMRAAPVPGAEVALAGERIGAQSPDRGPDRAEPGSDAEREARQEEEARRDTQRLAGWLKGETDPEEAQRLTSRAVTPRDLLTGSSFALTAETDGKDLVSLWGRAAVTRFDGREGDLMLDGEVVTGMLGADWTGGRWTAGLIVSHSTAEGGYSGAPVAGDAGSGGKVEATLTGLFPWARHALSERLEAWGAAGYGAGELTVTPKAPGTGGDGPAIHADLDLRMAAVGLRGTILDGGADGLTLIGKTDAMAVQTASGRGRGTDGGNLEPARATVTRLRLGVEASRPVGLGGGAALTLSLEIGVRHDGGDAETGFGLDLGGGLALSDPKRGLQAELRGRGLLTHESKGFRDLGFSGSLAWEGNPGSDRGAKLRLTQTVGGSSSGGADALLARTTLEGLAANDDGEGGDDELKSRRLELKFGYGLSAFGDRFTWTPEVGVDLSDTGRDYSLGSRMVLGGSGSDGGALELSFEARRRESANDDTPPEHEVGLRLSARW